MSADAMSDEADGPLAFELGNWNAITGRGGVDEEDCVGDVVVQSALTWATPVNFRKLLRSF